MTSDNIAGAFRHLQDEICAALESADGKGRFQEDLWEHHSGGGGRTRLIQQGHIIEKGGVNFSAVEGPVHPKLLAQIQGHEREDLRFFATGVSIVMHPSSPKVPIIHMNVRYFELNDGSCWFGGGIDLTPHYVVEEDARYFHGVLKNVCDRHHPEFYDRFRDWADDYFFLPHRNETRGVGGIFFDYLKPDTPLQVPSGTVIGKTALFSFVKAVGEAFAPVYTELMLRRNNEPFTEEEKEWQHLRRGRYAEFNLVWDRGTKFGLESGGRTESILMSLPPQARWAYNMVPEPGSAEAVTLSLLRKGIRWV